MSLRDDLATFEVHRRRWSAFFESRDGRREAAPYVFRLKERHRDVEHRAVRGGYAWCRQLPSHTPPNLSENRSSRSRLTWSSALRANRVAPNFEWRHRLSFDVTVAFSQRAIGIYLPHMCRGCE